MCIILIPKIQKEIITQIYSDICCVTLIFTATYYTYCAVYKYLYVDQMGTLHNWKYIVEAPSRKYYVECYDVFREQKNRLG